MVKYQQFTSRLAEDSIAFPDLLPFMSALNLGFFDETDVSKLIAEIGALFLKKNVYEKLEKYI